MDTITVEENVDENEDDSEKKVGRFGSSFRKSLYGKMVKVDHFDIIFEGRQNVFKAGENLSGNIFIAISETLTLNGISLRVRGKAQTQWSTHHGKSSTQYLGEETYFDHCPELDYLNDFPGGILPEGNHEIPFCYPLAKTLPSSFESANGHVRYMCIATIKRSALHFDLSCKRAFSVIANEDLNTIAEANEPVDMRENQDILCCCTSRGMVQVTINLFKRGYVPGEVLPIFIEVINNSRKYIDNLILRLKQYITYYGDTTFAGFKGQYDTSQEVFRADRTLDVGPGGEASLPDFRFQIPALPPQMTGCNIIDIHYTIKIDIGNYMRFEIPLILGTIPVKTDTPESEALPSINEGEESPPPPPPPPYGRPIQTYMESAMGQVSLENDEDHREGQFGDRHFTPVYAYYDKKDLPAKELK